MMKVRIIIIIINNENNIYLKVRLKKELKFIKTKYIVMRLFQSELGLSVLDLLGRSIVFGRWAPL